LGRNECAEQKTSVLVFGIAHPISLDTELDHVLGGSGAGGDDDGD
jgi:hypothetical protein